MDGVYLDNASTSFPKPKSMADAMYHYMTATGTNINRGGYESAYDVEERVYETRELLCNLFNGEDCKNVIFTKNITESLNVILKGFLKSGDHVILSSMEHNAVMRPMRQLEARGVSFSRVLCDETGALDPCQLPKAIRENTVAVVMLHASNVCGTVMPLLEVGSFCNANNLKFIVDSAQTAGVCPIDMKAMHIDALAFTGHKGLLGPQGIGGFLLTEEMVHLIEPLLSGGTGSISHTEDIPTFMPDRFEPDTLNLPGIIGLRESLLWLNTTGIKKIHDHELTLTDRFLRGLLPLERDGKLRIVGKKDTTERIGVISIQTADLAQIAYDLDDHYGIMTRVGLHCSPSAHQTLSTYPAGTLRFSFGWWNTPDEVDRTLTALQALLEFL